MPVNQFILIIPNENKDDEKGGKPTQALLEF